MEARDSFCFPKKTKNPNPSPIGKKFGFCCCGAPPGTRTLGPLIKRNQRATIVNFQNCVNSLFLSFYRKFVFCICCILCTCCPLSHPLSSRSGVQKVCKNVQSQNQPLKQALSFYAKPGKRPGSSPKRQLKSYLFRPSIKCTSTTMIHGRDLDNRTDTTLYRKKFPMNKLLSCRYNMDTNRVEARFEGGTTLAIDCIAVEDEYGNTPAQRAELDWLLWNKPLEYAQLVLGGKIEHYLSLGCDHGRMED